jgi:phosphonopyruvate decarboxylase
MLAENGFTFFCGIPDSTFKHWLRCLDDCHGQGLTNRIVAIERDAIGYAAGYFCSTGRTAVVYLQNSGLGNIINPLTSLACEQVCCIPLLLMIGWRGEPGRQDEPQHSAMGQIMLPLLEVLGIKHAVLPPDSADAGRVLYGAADYLAATGRAYALIIRDNTFNPYQAPQPGPVEPAAMTREQALGLIAQQLGTHALIIATTGKTSRELFEHRNACMAGHNTDFLMVGAMGLAGSMAAEVALQQTQRKIFIFDGDAALLMSAGNLATIGYYAPPNLYHIVFDNGCHDSTGGQPSISRVVVWEKLAEATGYKGVAVIAEPQVLREEIMRCIEEPGPRMLVVKVSAGSRPDLGRPSISPFENRVAFMREMGVER